MEEAERVEQEKCGGPEGKTIFASRQEAQNYARGPFAARHGGRGKVYWCVWSSCHYHVTKGLMGRRGSAARKGRQR